MTRRYAFILSLALTAAACSRHSAPPAAPASTLDRAGLESVVGRRSRGDSLPIPDAGFRRAWLIVTTDSTAPAFALQHLTLHGRDLIVMQREQSRSGSLPVWMVTDAAYLPTLDRVNRIATSCGYGETPDTHLFAVVTDQGAGRRPEVRFAWSANSTTGKVEQATARGLLCSADEGGSP